VVEWGVTQPSIAINATYHCRRAKQDGLILVLNSDEYLMAEYSERTGDTKYQRLVPAPQKDVIERWLGNHFPAKNKSKVAATTL
jgi:hypothetical protein